MKKPKEWKKLTIEEKFEAVIGIMEDVVDILDELEKEVLDKLASKPQT
jgi:hypothetical protein